MLRGDRSYHWLTEAQDWHFALGLPPTDQPNTVAWLLHCTRPTTRSSSPVHKSQSSRQCIKHLDSDWHYSTVQTLTTDRACVACVACVLNLVCTWCAWSPRLCQKDGSPPHPRRSVRRRRVDSGQAQAAVISFKWGRSQRPVCSDWLHPLRRLSARSAPPPCYVQTCPKRTRTEVSPPLQYNPGCRYHLR